MRPEDGGGEPSKTYDHRRLREAFERRFPMQGLSPRVANYVQAALTTGSLRRRRSKASHARYSGS